MEAVYCVGAFVFFIGLFIVVLRVLPRGEDDNEG